MAVSTTDLADLMERVADGDRVAFAQLYAATSAKLYGIILRILQRRDLADEALQDVYVRIWQQAGLYDRARASAITWMATIARNRALDEVRRKSVLRLDDTPEALNMPDASMSAPEVLERQEDWARLEACLSALPPERQAIVRNAYLDGWSREQLAAHYGQQVATIKTWLHRSLKQLKDCLGA